ncbi:MAG: type II toxin-antitoxin system HicA family toxin [Bdellovibrionota bacterium]
MSPRLPSLTAKQVLRALLRAGFYVHHQVGSHATLKHPSDPRKRVTVPMHARELPRGTLLAIVKQAGMSPEEFAGYL